MKKLLLVLGLSMTLFACSSGVKLDTPPVEDRAATQVGNGMGSDASAGSGSGVGQSSVTQVNLANAGSGAQGPSNVAKVIYFDYDSYQIRPDALPSIEAHAKWLAANRSRRAALEGHTDSAGGREYNLALGQRRADAVKRSLSVLGVSEQQLESVSFGEEKPADGGASEAAMANNRRVEVFYR
jgi:peptidoglycan-associated lipoprotein